MDHKREHRTPPTCKGHGSGLTTTTLNLLFDVDVTVNLLFDVDVTVNTLFDVDGTVNLLFDVDVTVNLLFDVDVTVNLLFDVNGTVNLLLDVDVTVKENDGEFVYNYKSCVASRRYIPRPHSMQNHTKRQHKESKHL